MKRLVILAAFVTLVLAHFGGVNLSLLPGLSVKNAALYAAVAWIALEAAIDARGGGTYGRVIDYPALHGSFLILIGFAALSMLVCLLMLDYPGYGIGYGVGTLKQYVVDHYLMLFVFLAAARTEEDAKSLAGTLLLILALGCVTALVDTLGIANLNIMDPRRDGRFQGPIGSNEYGALMAFSVPLAVAMLFQAQGRARLLWAFVSLVFVLVLLFTASRGAVIGLVSGSTIGAILLYRHARVGTVLKIAGVFAVIALAAVLVLLGEHGDLLYGRFVVENRAATGFELTSGRSQIWAGAASQMLDAPLTLVTGFGWKTFDLLNPIASHNEYLECYFNLGVVGLGLLLLMQWSVVRYLMRAVARAPSHARPLVVATLVSFLSILVAVFFTTLHEVWLYVWAFAGVGLRYAAAAVSSGGRQVSDIGHGRQARQAAAGRAPA